MNPEAEKANLSGLRSSGLTAGMPKMDGKEGETQDGAKRDAGTPRYRRTVAQSTVGPTSTGFAKMLRNRDQKV